MYKKKQRRMRKMLKNQILKNLQLQQKKEKPTKISKNKTKK